MDFGEYGLVWLNVSHILRLGHSVPIINNPPGDKTRSTSKNILYASSGKRCSITFRQYTPSNDLLRKGNLVASAFITLNPRLAAFAINSSLISMPMKFFGSLARK